MVVKAYCQVGPIQSLRALPFVLGIISDGKSRTPSSTLEVLYRLLATHVESL